MEIFWWYTLLALLMLGLCAGLLLVLGQRYRQRQRFLARINASLPRRRSQPPPPGIHPWLVWPATQATVLLRRAGLAPSPRLLLGAGASLLLAPVAGLLLFGPAGAVLLPVGGGAAAGGLLYYRSQRRRRLMVAQIPTFIDQLLRAVAAGHTLDAALLTATADSRLPLGEVLEQVTREIKLGGEIDTALSEAIRLYDLEELRLLALAIRVNRRYGSSIQELLRSLVTLIQQEETSRQEFRALTGESRLTAWVLGLMPLLLVGFLLLTNPEYPAHLWHDPAGRTILLIALLLQSGGVLALWRLTRVL
ncbi:type II secretion system F family protein [Desulfurivibrio alkaliphilus]|uniref:Type II secretion system F domain protein n=1 Tax=Desulfurivibrio alkaliphilus (strain DSM 19089 / UNIQEM U267 / AHT2) TaxID=589865 RepID=D6Z1Q0_DESAT|nr:type II secretion system F family protein [Desulfurivibrio alkaliphilus]ADH85475.1 Type II secretion system F domain protein [Desulfurivibrio alkaliphilus AHT 2]